MTWQTLRDFIDTRWAAGVSGYTEDVRTTLKAGPVSAIARGIEDEGLLAGGWTNVYSETYSFANATISADRQAIVESTYGDAWWAHRPTGLHASCTIASGVWTLVFAGHGAEDTWGSGFSGPGLALPLNGRLPLIRGQSLVLSARCRISNPSSYNVAQEWCRVGALISGVHPGNASRSFCGAVLEISDTIPAGIIRGIVSISGSGAAFGGIAAPDLTYFTAGTELEVWFSPDMTCSFRFRKTGDVAWTSGGATQLSYGMSAMQVWFGCGHGLIDSATTVQVDQIGMRIE